MGFLLFLNELKILNVSLLVFYMVNLDKYNTHKQQLFVIPNAPLKSVSGSWGQNFLELIKGNNGWIVLLGQVWTRKLHLTLEQRGN